MDRDPLAWEVHRHVIDVPWDELFPPADLTRDLTRDLDRDLDRQLALVAALQSHRSRRRRAVALRARRAGRGGRAVPRAVRR